MWNFLLKKFQWLLVISMETDLSFFNSKWPYTHWQSICPVPHTLCIVLQISWDSFPVSLYSESPDFLNFSLYESFFVHCSSNCPIQISTKHPLLCNIWYNLPSSYHLPEIYTSVWYFSRLILSLFIKKRRRHLTLHIQLHRWVILYFFSVFIIFTFPRGRSSWRKYWSLLAS